MSRAALDAITDTVLTHRYQARPLKVIAGEPGSPLVIGEVEIPCYVLEGEMRVLSERGFLTAIGRSERSPSRPQNGADKLPGFLSADNLKPFIGKAITAPTTPIVFQLPQGGRSAHGYPALLLPQVCRVYLDARRDGALLSSQQHVAERAEILTVGLANVGIIALVDEATGYQRVREERALATILERFLAAELQSWTRTFDYEFYEQIFRLKGWGSPEGVGRPQVIGKYTNDFVYERIAPGVLAELRARNPVMPQGWRKNRHHQWFTPEFGHPMLREHIHAVIALMRAASSWSAFRRSLDRAFPKIGDTIPLALDED